MEGDAEPTDRPPVKDRRATTWTWSSEWRTWVTAWREESPWSLLVKLAGPLVEVLPETPEPAETPITTSVEDKIFAPWDNETVDALNDFQVRLVMHPFTCGAEHFTPGEQVLIATPGGWICPCSPACGYTQGWAHSFMADREAWPEQMSVRAWDRVAEGLPPAQSSQDVPIPLSESVETNTATEGRTEALSLEGWCEQRAAALSPDGKPNAATNALWDVIDEIRRRKPSSPPADEVEWGYRRATDPESLTRRASATYAMHTVDVSPGEWVVCQRRPAGPWSVVEPVEPKETPDA